MVWEDADGVHGAWPLDDDAWAALAYDEGLAARMAHPAARRPMWEAERRDDGRWDLIVTEPDGTRHKAMTPVTDGMLADMDPTRYGFLAPDPPIDWPELWPRAGEVWRTARRHAASINRRLREIVYVARYGMTEGDDW